MPDPVQPVTIPEGTPAATPPVTPPATPPVTPPATPPADAPIGFPNEPAAPAPTPPTDAVIVYEKTGDAALDVALRFVGQRGFGPEHPAMQAAMKGDFAALESELGKLGDKASGYQEYIGLAKESFGRKQAATEASAKATAKIVHDAVGGAENWNVIQAWAAANADADEKAQLNAAFKVGGVAAASAAAYLAGLYAKYGKAAPKSAVKPDASSSGGNDSTALSPREYAAAVRDLSAKLGTKMETSPEYRALVARRKAYRG